MGVNYSPLGVGHLQGKDTSSQSTARRLRTGRAGVADADAVQSTEPSHIGAFLIGTHVVAVQTMLRIALAAFFLTIPAPVFSETQNCTYTLSTLSLIVPAAGGTGTVSVTTGAGCNWAASGDRTWLSVPGNTGVGSGAATWVAAANPLPTQRIGFLSIAGISVFVTQLQPTTPAPTPTPPPTAAGAPRQVVATVSGNSVTLTWSAPDTGGAPTTYVLAAGSAAGWSNLGSFPTGGTQPSFTANNVPNGRYFARVSAQNAMGTSPASNEVSFTVPQGCTSEPVAPSTLQSAVSGAIVTLTWVAPAEGATPTAYAIEAGSGPSLADLARITIGATATTFSATAPHGTYYVRVRALTSCGMSPPSPEVGIVVR